MLPCPECRLIRHQQGAVLLVLAVIMSMIALGWLYGHMASRQESGAVTARALAMARSALIGRALSDASHPGSLPCPDTDNDGVAQLLSGAQCPGYIGRLPWRTLGLNDIRDGNGERLWYVLSSDARDAQSQIAVNSLATAGMLQMNTSAHLVAVLFSPGVAIVPQQRGTSAQQNTVGNYLEGDNANGDTVYVSQAVADTAFNDIVLAISSADVFRKVERLVLQQIAKNLAPPYLYAADPYATAEQLGVQQIGRLAGFIPYKTLGFSLADPLGSNGWFNDLTSGSTSPYIVTAAQDHVQINLKYCSGSMDSSSAMMVIHCV
ncbi:hypothetical protein [Sulfuriferula thiophila]|uniref:hypothetical protein n=1 Tax=Sulfuriferula thiophila TaxID=1781211 RepID=UPI000F6076E6|nr:hypothetical protein [Sulfuriferula thiophila]